MQKLCFPFMWKYQYVLRLLTTLLCALAYLLQQRFMLMKITTFYFCTFFNVGERNMVRNIVMLENCVMGTGAKRD